jgi:hypothetical protein
VPLQLVQIMESREDVQFIKVNYEDNKALSRTLGVKVLPTFHMYRGPSGRVAEFSASLSKIQRLRDALEAHGAPRCVLGDATPLLVRARVPACTATALTLRAQPTELSNPVA